MQDFTFIKQALKDAAARGRQRELRPLTPLKGSRVRWQGKELVNLSSNDYLGLAEHPLLAQRAAEYAAQYGAGSKASRLVCAEIPPFAALEAKLANLKGQEAALIFNSGFQANCSLPGLFAQKGDLILCDRLIHNSLIQGSLLSGARMRRFAHNDLADLENKLAEAQTKGYGRLLVLTESVFSMDGDRADLEGIKNLTDQANALLLVDEAHATGVLGPQGMGLATGLGIDLVMGTFGKGLGGFGAYFACPKIVRDYALNFAPGFIYTTALPPSVLGAMDAALELAPQMGEKRKKLHALATNFRKEASRMGYDCLNSSTQIVPLWMGSEERAIACMNHLLRQGFLAVAIRPPTVAPGQSRLRLAFNAALEEKDIHRLLGALHDFKG